MKRFLSLLLTFITLLGAMTPAFAAPTPEEAMTDVRIYAVGDSVSHLLYDGDPKSLTPAYYTTKSITGVVTEYPAYCINPHLPGPSVGGPYSVDTKSLISNPKIWGIITNGYPYKTIGELGVHTREQAFYATKMALWTYINGWDVNLWTAANGEQAATLAAVKKIYAAGMAVSEIREPIFTVAADKPKAEIDALDPNFASQTFTVSADVEIRSYEVALDDSIPGGTKVTDLSNNSKTVFSPGEKFKVLIPADRISNATGNFEVTVRGQLKTDAVLYGVSFDPSLQDFAVTRDPFSFEDATATVLYSPQNTFLEIVKLAAGTNSPLAGAVFKVTGPDGVVGTFATDASGKTAVPLTKAGAYSVEEITPPSGYLPGVTSHKDVTVLWEQKTTVTFTNEKKPGLSIHKVDADTGAGLPGAVIRIAREGGMKLTDVQTDSSGRAYLTDIAPGPYSVVEITAPEGYIPNSTPQTVILEAGKTATVTVVNSQKPGLIIRKFDEDTGLPLAGAEFSVAHKGGSVVYEGITDASGVIRPEGLSAGWYTVTELAAPHGYLKTWETKDVYLEPGKVVEVKFDNRLKPALRLLKVDAQTNAPLAGAKFKVWKTEGGTAGEYVTDANGMIAVYDLEEAVYSVEEIAAPEGYVLSPQRKDIRLVWGEVKQLVFTNAPKPALVIRKFDEDTGLPLAGAEFSVAHKGGSIVHEGITGMDGTIRLDDPDEGWYTVTELAAPHGYLKTRETKDVYLEPGKVVEVKFDNRLRPALKLIKLDAQTSAPLAGAKFKVQKTEDATVSEYVTGTDGTVTIYDLDEAVYSVWEFEAPNGYLLDTQHKDIAPEWGKVKELVFTNRARPVLEIVKLDRVTRRPLFGVKFRVTKTEGNTTGDYITGADGKITIKNLDDAVYTVEEISVPDTHILAPGRQTIELEWGKTKTVIYENDKKPRLTITKTDEVTKTPLRGAVFNITVKNGRNLGDFTTDGKGEIVFERLDPDLYVITEVKAPDGYAVTGGPQDVRLVSNGDHLAEFRDKALSPLYIKKADAKTGLPVEGAKYRVVKMNGEFVGEYATDRYGFVSIPRLEPGWYTVFEIYAPTGYTIDVTPKSVEVRLGEPAIVEFTDKPFGGLLVKKVDDKTGAALPGVDFNITKVDGSHVGDYTTDERGAILLPSLEPGNYVIRETRAAAGYILAGTPKTIEVKWGEIAEVTFRNKAMSGLQIVKIDADTKQPLKDAKFTLYKMSGEIVGTYTTNGDGVIVLDKLAPGWYKVAESRAPEGYLIDDTPQDVEVTSDRFIKLVFENRKMSGLIVRKVEAVTLKPLTGAEFSIKTQDGRLVGNYRTAADGTFSVSALSPGRYTVTETKAPSGYILDDNAQTVEITHSKTVTLEFQNKPLASIQIKKVDEFSDAPLSGAKFTVHHQGGALIGDDFTTGADGTISIPAAEPGWYIVRETRAPQGYTLDETAKTIEVKASVPAVVTFTNKPLSGIEILKTDAYSHAPLSGATFTVERDTGEKIGAYKTDSAGKILVSGLTEGTYVVSETVAPEGYILDAAPQTVVVKSGKLTTAEFVNKPLSGLKILKLDSATRQPIAGVEFSVSKMDGEHVPTEFGGTAFKTDKAGQIYIPGLADGYYTVTEIKQAEGYILDAEPKTVLIQSGKPTVLEVLNTPQSGLLIVKTDANTGKPLAGVLFDVTRADGRRVSGNILNGNRPDTEANSPNRTTSPNGDISGSYTTDAQGRILINALPAGEYRVTERKALDGYELDTEVHAVTVTPGKPATLQLTNTPKAGLRVIKIDSITKAPIYGVEFMVFDSNGVVVGRYITDNNGVIDFTGVLSEGRYTIRETKAAPGYYLDEIPKTIEFTAGKVTEIRWENTPQAGQIQITKRSGDDNEVNGLPKGSPLAGAVFEVYAHKSGSLVDRFISGADGRAVSKPLPPGRYTVKEVQAPRWYKLSDRTLDVELEFATQIVKLEYLNYSVNTGVTIRKTGNYEAMPGDTIFFTIKELRNTSTVPLTDFYWRDILPTDAVRLSRIVTGTYNQSLKYKVTVTTNKGDTRVIADNLSTTKNNVIDCAGVSLGLRSDEYVTSFTLLFGTVKAGFTIVEQPQIYVKVLPNLPNGCEFANKCDVAGKYGSEWVAGNSTWRVKTYAKPEKLPRTGY
ncbi:MAG: Cys-Gln thioester bond-forming surface protein [Clostridiales Family XIII bacterium]|jgi:uncharacterized repeat protein (TIGR01451 family)|nr:Cys-Gln thioester bond-forming surface protein [Clostridiales Family XIII bacterium]